MTSRWSIYFKERFPIIPNILVALGITQSVRFLSERTPGTSFAPLSIGIAFMGGMLFLAQIRLMDEYKDFEKDKIAHPERPLPRGLFAHAEFGQWITRFNGAMILLAIISGFSLNAVSGVMFAIGTLYLHLMFKEFYVGDWLSKRPMLYAITHQLILFPMGAFVFSCFLGREAFGIDLFWFCTLLFGGFFGFEVGRKLDPHAHPILKTYLSTYGSSKTAFLMLALLGVSTQAGKHLGVDMILGPIYILILLASSLIWWAPSKFKVIEGFVTIYLLLLIWAIPIRHLMGSI